MCLHLLIMTFWTILNVHVAFWMITYESSFNETAGELEKLWGVAEERAHFRLRGRRSATGISSRW